MSHLPAILFLFPLCGMIGCILIGKRNLKLCKYLVITSLFCSLICAILLLTEVLRHETPLHYWLGGWKPPYGVELSIDGVNGLILVLIASISFFTALFSEPFERKTEDHSFSGVVYYAMLGFLAVGLMGMATSGDVFLFYVFMEVTAVSGYGLIAAGEEKGPIAAFRYLMTGSIGSSMYLLGIGFLYAVTGTLNMDDLAAKLAIFEDTPLVILASICLLVGFGIKMALFPLHGWQPAAHSYAHPGADPMIGGIMIKVPAYAMLRFFFYLFQEGSQTMGWLLSLIGIMAVCSILFGSLKALQYDTYNKILAYSSIGQIGYIAMGFAIGNFYGLVGAVLHIVGHGFMKAGLFYTSGALKYKYDIHDIRLLGQIYRQMPITSAAMTVCMLSMIGLPPFTGFFSKWYLALGAVQRGQYFYVAVLLFSSLLSAVYFFRIMESIFMGAKTESFSCHKERFELPWQMLLPLVGVVTVVIGLGLFNSYFVDSVLAENLTEVFL